MSVSTSARESTLSEGSALIHVGFRHGGWVSVGIRRLPRTSVLCAPLEASRTHKEEP